MTGLERLYGPRAGERFVARHAASCQCRAVRYHVCADPADAKICHCRTCQKTHGAPMQWAAIFHKRDVRITQGIERIAFYNTALDRAERILPCKLRCAGCGTPIADEGRNMWLAFPTLFDFGAPPEVPESIKPTCHIFYDMRVMDMDDGLPKWSAHKDASIRL